MVDKALQMSDEDFLASSMSMDDSTEEVEEAAPPPKESQVQDEIPDKEPEDEVVAEDEPEEPAEEGDVEEEEEEEWLEDEEEEAEQDDASEEELLTSDPHEDSVDTSSDQTKDAEVTTEDAEEAPTDFKSFHDIVTAPFKANGKTMQINSAKDAIQLMQMGANYNRKMSALKPQLKVLRMLENHDLLDENKLSFLIDLNRQDPTAINQLLKDSDIDPADIDLEEDQQYQRSNYGVAESEMDLDSVVSELKGSEYWSPVLDVVTKQWDDESKQIVADKPQLLKVIHNHMATGVYDLVSTELERERMFGRLNGMSDLEAYEMIGNALNDSGAFAHLDGNPAQKTIKSTSKVTGNKVNDQARREKRRANSPTKRTAKSKVNTDSFNPLALSDEEFSKQFDPRFS